MKKKISRNNGKVAIKRELAAHLEEVQEKNLDFLNYRTYIDKTNKRGA